MLLHQQFVLMAKKHPEKIAIIDRSTNQRYTYSRALKEALILSSEFQKYDDEFIGIMLPTSADCALATIGTLMSGKVPVMINYSTGAQANALYAQDKCKFKTVITSKEILKKTQCPVIEGMVMIEDIMGSNPAGMGLNDIYKGDENDTAAIIFTSGSENNPKAVQLTHRNIISNVEAFGTRMKFGESDILFATLVFFHVFGLTVDLWTAFYYGMTMVTYSNLLDFKTICDIAQEEKPTIMVGTPSFIWGYLRKSKSGDFKSVRIMITGADKCPDTLRDGFMEKHGVTILEGYGATETSPVISVSSPEYNRPGSTGKVLPGVKVKIGNLETGEECETGEVGKILVKGDSVMKGYYEDPDSTAAAFVDGWYDTGDMGYLDEDGYLWHSGRFRRFVKVGGEMISLVKVENTLEKYLPMGVSCCVVDVEDKVKGSAIIATVTIEVNKSEILRKMEKDLPKIALPKHFIVIRELPMMSSGKIDFRSVTAIVQEILSTPEKTDNAG